MVTKREAAPEWPMLKGEYDVGNVKNCVAVITCGSHLASGPQLEAGAAITGPCKTENLGIEKVVAHIISNPNIRYFIVTGAEVKGHITGQAMLSLHRSGVKDNRGIWLEHYDGDEHLAPGNGIIDYSVLNELAGYRGIYNMEVFSMEDVVKGKKTVLNAIRIP